MTEGDGEFPMDDHSIRRRTLAAGRSVSHAAQVFGPHLMSAVLLTHDDFLAYDRTADFDIVAIADGDDLVPVLERAVAQMGPAAELWLGVEPGGVMREALHVLGAGLGEWGITGVGGRDGAHFLRLSRERRNAVPVDAIDVLFDTVFDVDDRIEHTGEPPVTRSGLGPSTTPAARSARAKRPRGEARAGGRRREPGGAASRVGSSIRRLRMFLIVAVAVSTAMVLALRGWPIRDILLALVCLQMFVIAVQLRLVHQSLQRRPAEDDQALSDPALRRLTRKQADNTEAIERLAVQVGHTRDYLQAMARALRRQGHQEAGSGVGAEPIDADAARR